MIRYQQTLQNQSIIINNKELRFEINIKNSFNMLPKMSQKTEQKKNSIHNSNKKQNNINSHNMRFKVNNPNYPIKTSKQS